MCKTLVEILCELSSIVTDNAFGSEKSTARRNIVRYCCRPRTDFTTQSIGSIAPAATLLIKHRVLSKESLSLYASFSKGRHGSDVRFIMILNSARCIKKKTHSKFGFFQRHHRPLSHSKLLLLWHMPDRPGENQIKVTNVPAGSQIVFCRKQVTAPPPY